MGEVLSRNRASLPGNALVLTTCSHTGQVTTASSQKKFCF